MLPLLRDAPLLNGFGVPREEGSNPDLSHCCEGILLKLAEEEMGNNRQERIRQRAHAIWEQEGQPHGAHQRHWDQATSEIDAEDSQASSLAENTEDASPIGGDGPALEQVAGAGPAIAEHSKETSKPKGKSSRTKAVKPSRTT
jgi:Protein of unknown function (DUF2934)